MIHAEIKTKNKKLKSASWRVAKLTGTAEAEIHKLINAFKNDDNEVELLRSWEDSETLPVPPEPEISLLKNLNNKINNNTMGTLTFINQKVAMSGIEYPLQLRKNGDITLNKHLVREKALEKHKYVILEAEENASEVTLFMFTKQEPNFFKFNDPPSQTEKIIRFNCSRITKQLKLTETKYYKLKTIKLKARHPDYNEECIKVVFEIKSKP